MIENNANVIDTLEGLGIEAYSTIPSDLPSINDLRNFKFKIARVKTAKFVDAGDMKQFRNEAINVIETLTDILTKRDDDVKRVCDLYLDAQTKLHNANDEIELMRENGVEVVAETIGGVETEIAVELTELKRYNRELLAKVADLENGYSNATAEVAQFRLWGQEVNEEYSRMEQDNKDKDEKIAELTARVGELQAPGSGHHTIAEAKERYEKELEFVESEKRKLADKIAYHESRVNELLQENRNLRAQVDSYMVAEDEESASVDSETVEKLEQAVLSLKGENEELRETNRKYSKYSEEIDKYAQELENENRQLRDELKLKSISGNDGFGSTLPSDPFDLASAGGMSLEEIQRRFSME